MVEAFIWKHMEDKYKREIHKVSYGEFGENEFELHGFIDETFHWFDAEGNEVTRILGHYDITAVEKYIMDYKKHYGNYYIGWSSTGEHKEISIKKGNELIELIGVLRQKPLHLFTEQEDKDLLTLLLKLQKGKN